MCSGSTGQVDIASLQNREVAHKEQQKLKQTFTASVGQEGDWYVAQCLEVDIASQGESEEEALANLGEALELHFEPDVRTVEVESMASLRGAAGSLETPRSWEEIIQIAREDHVKEISGRVPTREGKTWQRQ